MKKIVIGVGLLVAAGAAVAAVVNINMLRGLPTESVSTSAIPRATVERGPFEVDVTSIGELKAENSVVLSAPYGGTITKLIPEGTRVEEGDPVVWFETEEHEQSLQEELAQLALEEKDLEAAKEAYELEKLKNQLTLESERTSVEIARKEFENAKQKYEAEQVLFEKKISPETRLDEARLQLLQSEMSLRNAQINLAKVEENLESNLRVKERDIEKAELNVERRQVEVNEERRRIEQSIIRASRSGEIAYLKTWKSGQVSKITEGDSVWRRTNLAEIPDTTQMMASVPVNEIDYNKIEPGQRAVVRVDALPGREFPGVVESRSVAPISDPNQRSWDSGNGSGPNEYEIRVRVDSGNNLFRQGMTASARIIVEEMEDTIYIPLEAVTLREGEQGVWRLEENKPTFESVRLVMVNDNFAAVEGNLSAGQRVLLRDPFDMDEEAEELFIEDPEGEPTEAPGQPVMQDMSASAETGS